MRDKRLREVESGDLFLQSVSPFLDFWLDANPSSIVDTPTIAALHGRRAISPNCTHGERSDLLIHQQQFSLSLLKMQVWQNSANHRYYPSRISTPSVEGTVVPAFVTGQIDCACSKRISEELGHNRRCLADGYAGTFLRYSQVPIRIQDTSQVSIQGVHSTHILPHSVAEGNFYER